MKVIAIVQARMGSTRLKGKVLELVEGKTIIEHIVDRVKESKYVHEVVVATPVNEVNSELINFLSKKRINVYVGSENDVLTRFISTATFYGADLVVRITGDNPLTCIESIDNLLKCHIEQRADYSTIEGLPIGMGSEVVNLSTLLQISKMSLEEYHKEHVTLFLKENPDIFKLNFLKISEDLRYPELRLTVDTIEDLRVIREIYKNLYEEDKIIKTIDVLKYVTENSDVMLLNKDVVQKKR